MLTNNLFKRWTYKFFAPDLLQRETYESFKRLLVYDRKCHEMIADFQDLLYKKEPTEWSNIILLYNQLSEAVGAMSRELSLISSENTANLYTYYRKFDSWIRCLMQPESNPTTPPFVLWLENSQVKSETAGNKAANLAALQQNLNFSIPTGFIITTSSWHNLVEYNDLRPQLNSHLQNLNASDSQSLKDTSRALMSLIEGAEIPPEVNQSLETAMEDLFIRTGKNPLARFAVRSSGVNEDGPNSFAGQYQSILDVPLEDIGKSYLRVLSSKYTPKALLYRITAGVSDTESSMAVLVIEMIKSMAAGVTYTTDPTGEEKDTVFIHSVAGQGEKLVSGRAQPHISYFTKNNIQQKERSGADCPISEKEAKLLARQAIGMETFFGSPQDIEWAIEEGKIYTLQSRPLQAAPEIRENKNHQDQHDSVKTLTQGAETTDKETLPLLYHGGITAAQGRGVGPAYFPDPEDDNLQLPDGAILIIDNTPTSLILLLPKCSGVISTRGSVASHFSTICREFRIPLIVGAAGIGEAFAPGEMVSIDADSRNVYRGKDESFLSEQVHGQSRKNIPYYRRLRLILDFIAPLTILDPEADSFTPEFCRSFHDIVRYSHEKGVQAMFAIGTSGSHSSRRKRLATSLPFELYLIDVDRSWRDDTNRDNTIAPDQLNSLPFRALWHGLTHPSITWGDHAYYNWKDYDSAAMTDGFAFKNKTESASYAVCGHDYLNLNIRFGYHFTIIDTLCGENMEQNYCLIRFAGGGGTFEGRYFRLQYVEAILRKVGFQVTCKTDLLDARLESLSKEQMTQCLVTVGRMLGTSKLMDMVLKNEESLASHLDIFFNNIDTITKQDFQS